MKSNKWEEVCSSLDKKENGVVCDATGRMKVPGGWLVRIDILKIQNNDLSSTNSMSFVPDPDHEWAI